MMKVSTAAVTLLSTLPSLTLVDGQTHCVTGGFRLEFDGACTADAIVAAYEDQVFNAAGGVPASCAMTAAEDLQVKLDAASMTLDDLCGSVYDNQNKVAFTSAANRGTDSHFEKMFYDGRTDWQEEVETLYETDDLTRTSILKEDAEAVRTFFDGMAQSHRVEWPGTLSNFQSPVKDANDLATCTTNAAMCCWPKDRQANDNNGNCNKNAEGYDVNCVNKNPGDNTNLCYVDMDRGNDSTHFDSDGIVNFPGDNNNGEGAIHCHGLAWANDVNDFTARYKANNLFFVSMYDHMYVRGYVQNIPGAPMCGCVEQMPTVSRSDCTQVDLTETVQVEYDTTAFDIKLTRVHVDFNACKGIDNRNNDLWAYMARLYNEGKITPAQFGEAGRIVTDRGCDHAEKYELNEKGLTPGYDHDVSTWTQVAGREGLQLHDGYYGHRAWNLSMRPGSADPSTGTQPSETHYGIIYRACQSCIRTHMKIFYRRRSPIPEDYNLMETILYRGNDGGGNNRWTEDFSLHSTHEDAVNDVDAWLCPNDAFDYGQNFYGKCSPDGTRVDGQRSRFDHYGDRKDVAYYVNKAEDEGLDIISHTAPTDLPATPSVEMLTVTHVEGRDYAGGMALQDPSTGTIYVSGSGRDIGSHLGDDFIYVSQPAEADHTVTVHASRISAPDFHGWSKNGIMFRTSMDELSPYFAIFLTGSYGACVQGRNVQGGGYSHFGCAGGSSGATEAWLKIERRLDTLTAFYGTQEVGGGDVTWTVVRTVTNWGPSTDEVYNVGLSVTSVYSKPIEVVFDKLEIDQYYFPSAAPSLSAMPSVYVASQDIGDPGLAGRSAQFADGSWSVSGAGHDIWGSNDSFHYVKGNPRSFENVTAELFVQDFQPNIYVWQKGGLMIRESLATNSRHFSFFLTGGTGLSNQWRLTNGGNSDHTTNSGLKAKPVWLKVEKVGNVFSSYYRYPADAEYTLHRSVTYTNFDTSGFYVGIAVLSHEPDQLVTLTASEFNVVDIDPPAGNNSTRRLRSAAH